MMTRQLLWAVVGMGLLGSGTGCVTCQNRAFAQSQKAYDKTGIASPIRQRVYLFLMNGADFIDAAGMCKLRDKVCEVGFPKVYLAQRADANWYEREVRRVARDDPSARVILLGAGIAADKILALADDVITDGVNLDAVILLDPSGTCEVPAEPPYRTLVIRSGGWMPGKAVIGAENIVVQKTGHLSLTNSPAVVDAVVAQMVASAQKIDTLPADPLPRTAFPDPPNPTPRPIEPAIFGPAPGGGWDFLNAAPSLTPLPVPQSAPAIPPASRPAATGGASVGAAARRTS